MRTTYYLVTKANGEQLIKWSGFNKADFEYQLSKFCGYEFTSKRISQQQAFDLKDKKGVEISRNHRG